MGIYRMYPGDDGETHIEEMTLESHPDLLNLQPVEGLRIWKVEEGRFQDFHPRSRPAVDDPPGRRG